MLKKLIEILKKAINKIFSDNEQTIQAADISDAMSNALQTWQDMYMNNASWIDRANGIYTLGLPKLICQEMSRYIMSELDLRAENEDIQAFADKLIEQLRIQLEHALALGGVVIKPYVSDNDIYISFCFPGEFYPLKFNADGRITDIVFTDKFTANNYRYTRVERHTLSNNTLTITNKTYKTKINGGNDTDLGDEIPLESVPQWQDIQPQTIIDGVDKPLFGFYKTPLANNIDPSSPLGISIFEPAKEMIERADRQFSRLDWEYEGGQMAIDVDQFSVHEKEGYFGTTLEMDATKNRLYRKIDLGQDNTYEAFTPTLRDTSYIQGLERYLRVIEDICGLARGAVSDVSADARTATEIKILKQRQYITVSEHQDMLETAIRDSINAGITLARLYNVYNITDNTNVTIEWKDSILTDTDTELQQRMNLCDKGILSDVEVRMWYTGEDEETAMKKIAEIKANKQQNMLNDIYSSIERQ